VYEIDLNSDCKSIVLGLLSIKTGIHVTNKEHINVCNTTFVSDIKKNKAQNKSAWANISLILL